VGVKSLAKPRARRALVVVVAALALAGCVAEPVTTPSVSPSVEVVPAYVDTWVEPAPTVFAPLLGTTVEAGSVDGPALSAKIDNHPWA